MRIVLAVHHRGGLPLSLGRVGPRIRRAAALLLAAAGIATAAHAQPAAAPAPFADTMARRVLACTGCHGAEGRATPDGYFPRIAGKPAGYLFHQLVHFRDGRRDYALMTSLLAHLDDRYLREIAAHFASLEVPYPPPAAPALSAAQAAHAERLVREGDAARRLPACAACHGTALTGVAPDVPGLVGLSRDYLASQIGAWRAGKRRAHAPDCMADVARALSLEDVAALTAWLAARPVPADAKPAPGFPAPLPAACGGVAATVAPR